MNRTTDTVYCVEKYLTLTVINNAHNHNSGPDNATNAVLPFIAAKGELAYKDDPRVDMFLMQEATYLASENHADLRELKAPGLPSVNDVLGELLGSSREGELIVCKPCAEVRDITEDIIDETSFKFGGAGDLTRQAARNDTTITF